MFKKGNSGFLSVLSDLSDLSLSQAINLVAKTWAEANIGCAQSDDDVWGRGRRGVFWYVSVQNDVKHSLF